MFNIERWQEIFEAISKNKLRTFLTGVSVASGIFILIILLGIANGFKNGTQRKFNKDAATLIEFKSKKTTKEYLGLSSGRIAKMTTDDFDKINQQYEEYIEYQSTSFDIRGLSTTYNGNFGSYKVIGTMADRQFLENATMVAGRFINQRDNENSLKVAVIGTKVVEDLYENTKEAIGTIIQVGQLNYKVIGVFKDANEKENSRLYLPHSTLIKLYSKESHGSDFLFTLKPEKDYDIALSKAEKFANQVKSKLQKVYKIHPEDSRGIMFRNYVKGAKDIYQLINGMEMFFWAIGILTLIAGIVGVSNIMLIIVKERTKEIGIRKALGAQPNAIIGMILHESIFITSISGMIGLLLGFTVLEIISEQIKTEFIYNPKVDFSIAISTLFLLIVSGAIAGYIPASYAAKIKPIIALRDE